MSRREKDATAQFTEKCEAFHDTMVDLGEVRPATLVTQNEEMLKAYPLFENGGNYSQDEVEWYRSQMGEID